MNSYESMRNRMEKKKVSMLALCSKKDLHFILNSMLVLMVVRVAGGDIRVGHLERVLGGAFPANCFDELDIEDVQ